MARKTFTFEGKRQDIKGKTDEEVAGKVALRKRDLEEGRLRISKNMLVRDWAKTWLSTYKGHLQPEGYKDCQGRLNNYILPELGNLQMKDVKQVHCKKVLNKVAGKSKSLALKIRMEMNEMFEAAAEDENNLITKNPAKKLKLPDVIEGSRSELTDEERRVSLQVAEYHQAGLWIKTILYCGLRPQETMSLRVKYINKKEHCVIIENAVKRSGEEGSPKSEAGFRVVPIPDFFRKELYVAIKGKNPDEYMFTQITTGKRHTKSSMRKMWASFKREMNIAMGCEVFRNQIIEPKVSKDLVPYCYRHTYGTDSIQAGVPLTDLKIFMGHEDVSTTQIYVHTPKKALNKAASKLDDYHKNYEYEEDGKKTGEQHSKEMGKVLVFKQVKALNK